MELSDQESRLAHFVSTAKQAGVKMTHQRLEIFKAIIQSKDHPDAESLLARLKATMPLVSIDTIYRSLWLLADLGLITTLGKRSESIRFDGNMKPHHHFVCQRCAKILDFYNQDFDRLYSQLDQTQFGAFLSSQVEIRGICPKCLASATDSDRPEETAN